MGYSLSGVLDRRTTFTFTIMALSSYIDHLQANPADRLNSKGATPNDIIAHAQSLGHEVTREELDDHAHSDASLDAAGGGSCYFNDVVAAI